MPQAVNCCPLLRKEQQRQYVQKRRKVLTSSALLVSQEGEGLYVLRVSMDDLLLSLPPFRDTHHGSWGPTDRIIQYVLWRSQSGPERGKASNEAEA